jgi:chromosome segregation ATPase
VSSHLHHHRDEAASPDVAPLVAEWLRRTSTALQRLHDENGSHAATFAKLDAVRMEFDRATSALGDVSERIRGSLEAQVGSLQAHVELVESEKRSLLDRAEELQHRADVLQSRVEAGDRSRDTLESAILAAQHDARAVRESASWRITAPLRAVYRLFR